MNSKSMKAAEVSIILANHLYLFHVQVQREIVAGLRFSNVTSRKGLKGKKPR